MTDADQEASPTTAEAVPAVPVTRARGLVRLRGADGFVQLRACAPKPQTSRQKGVAHANCGEEESEKGTMNKTSIAWVRGPDGAPGFTWNPVLGCRAVSKGCSRCYAARLASTRLAHLPAYKGLAYIDDSEDTDHSRVIERYRWSGEARFFPEKLAEPLRRRKPAGIFVCDMGDLFHESITDEQIAAVFGVMAACPQHRFYVLTKRAKRMAEWFERMGNRDQPISDCWEKATAIVGRLDVRDFHAWPLPNVMVGVSVEDQETADERIAWLQQSAAHMSFLSIEPLLGPVVLKSCLGKDDSWERFIGPCPHGRDPWTRCDICEERPPHAVMGISQVIVGGESGPSARPCHVEWIRSIAKQCRIAGVACFVKQLGENCLDRNDAGFDGGDGEWPVGTRTLGGEGFQGAATLLNLRDRAGADPAEWPEDLRVREFPKVSR